MNCPYRFASTKLKRNAAAGFFTRPSRKGFMITVTKGKVCEVCAKNEAVVVCNGCGKVLCRDCRTFDIWGSGCGHGLTQVFCPKCDADPKVNFWKASE
jgi:hypothetical protein